MIFNILYHEPSAHGGATHTPFVVPRTGGDRDLEHQLTAE